jgi:hypothetical protein
MGGRSIFINYRRDDTADVAGRIHDRLSAAFGAEAVYNDVDNTPIGVDFGAHIERVLGDCRVFIALIGPDWLEARDEAGARRLDDPADWVRREIELALATPGLQVVPLLVRGASVPAAGALPETLRGLFRYNAAHVRRDPDFHRDMDRLIAGIGEADDDTAAASGRSASASRPDLLPPRVEMPVREFRDSPAGDVEAVEDFRRKLRYGEHSRIYRAERQMPHHHSHVWRTLMQLEHFEVLFRGYFSNYYTAEQRHPPPKATVHPGLQFGRNRAQEYEAGTVLDGIAGKALTITWGGRLLTFEIVDFGPAESQVKLKRFYLPERQPTWFEKMTNGLVPGSSPEELKHEMDREVETMRGWLLRLRQLCDDFARFGKPVGWASDEALRWVDWQHRPGVLRILPRSGADKVLQAGETVGPGKIAYVADDKEATTDRAYYIANWYVEIERGVVADIARNDGDRIENGDRLFLLFRDLKT